MLPPEASAVEVHCYPSTLKKSLRGAANRARVIFPVCHSQILCLFLSTTVPGEWVRVAGSKKSPTLSFLPAIMHETVRDDILAMTSTSIHFGVAQRKYFRSSLLSNSSFRPVPTRIATGTHHQHLILRCRCAPTVALIYWMICNRLFMHGSEFMQGCPSQMSFTAHCGLVA